MALYHKWDVKKDFAYVLKFFEGFLENLKFQKGHSDINWPSQDFFFHTFSMALYHKWDVKNEFVYVLQFFSLISGSLGGV